MNDNFQNVGKEESFHFQLYLGQQVNKQNTAMDLTKNTEASRLYRPYEKESSAFKPFKKEESNNCTREFDSLSKVRIDYEYFVYH